MSYSVKKLAFTAVFVALSVLCNIYTLFIGAGAIGLSLTYLPIFLSGALFGPSVGFFVGIIGDGLGCIIAPQGAWIPFITLSSGLIGVIAGLVFKRKNNQQQLFTRAQYFTRITIGMLLILIVCTAGFNTVGLWLTYSAGKKTFLAYLAVRLPVQALTACLNAILITILFPILQKISVLVLANKPNQKVVKNTSAAVYRPSAVHQKTEQDKHLTVVYASACIATQNQ